MSESEWAEINKTHKWFDKVNYQKNSAEQFVEDDGLDIIPLQVSGTVDNDLSKCMANEMMWGLENLWKEGEEGGYAVRHGQ